MQCIFLHLGLLLSVLAASEVHGNERTQPLGLAGGEEQRVVHGLAGRVVELDCGAAAGLGIRLPLQGFVVAPGRVVTAAGVVEGWPERCGGLVVVGEGGRRWSAAVGVRDARIGLALLDVPGLMVEQAAARQAEVLARARGTVGPGDVLYALRAGGLVRVPVVARATDQRGYFWRVAGAPLPLGAPLFDGAGMLASVVGIASDDPELAGYALPTEALEGLFARQLEWSP